jgi:hypothetical protein
MNSETASKIVNNVNKKINDFRTRRQFNYFIELADLTAEEIAKFKGDKHSAFLHKLNMRSKKYILKKLSLRKKI